MLISRSKQIIFGILMILLMLLFAIVSSTFLSSCVFFKSEVPPDATQQTPLRLSHIVGVAMVEPVERTLSLHSKTSGVVAAIYHDINSYVKKGEVILRLDDQVQKKALDQAESRLLTQKSMILESKKQISLMQVRLNNLTKTYERDQVLISTNVISQQAFDNSEAAYLEARENLILAQQGLSTQKGRLSEIEKDIAYEKELLEQTRIRAPLDGHVLSMDLKLGENVMTNQAIGDFGPDGPWMAVTEIDEIFADKIQVGMKAYLRPQGALDTLALGKVFLASPSLRKKTLFLDSSSNMEDRRVREVRVLLEEHSQVLIGEKLECVILLDPTQQADSPQKIQE